jgi:pilus assembly protein CpaF
VLVHVKRDRAGRRRLSEIAVLKAGDDGRVRAVTAWHIAAGFGPGAEQLRHLTAQRRAA